MTRIYISRDNSFVGMTGLLHCYVNNTLIAKIKNDADATYDTDADTVEFRCHIPSGSLSDIYTLKLTGKRMVAITVNVSSGKPKIVVLDPSAVLNVKTVHGQDTSRTVIKNGVPVHLSSDDPNHKPFRPTKTVGNYFAMDDDSKQWAISKGLFSPLSSCAPYRYSDIVDFELLEDGSSVSKGGLGRAVVGYALFGGVGAIVGGVTGKKKAKQTCTSLMIKITLNDTRHPTEYIKLITSSTPKDGFVYKSEYKSAQEIMSLLQLIVNSQQHSAVVPQQHTVVVNQAASAADEIRRYKALMDDGIISQEEFEAKKRKLLGL